MSKALVAHLAVQAHGTAYNETYAETNFYFAVGAYCGAPKFLAANQQDWTCGPACTDAGSVTSISLFNESDLGVFGFVGRWQSKCVLAFRGTATPAAQTLDTEFALADFNHSDCSGCQVFKGYFEGYQAVRPSIVASLEGLGCTDLVITGHSLGAGISTLATFDLGPSYNIVSNYNFGSPRAGNPAFAAAYNALYSGITQRITHHKDPIPHGPETSQGYQHVIGQVFYNSETEDGYVQCDDTEDDKCADQYGGTIIKDGLLAACCANDHLSYMQDLVSIATDGDSCTHVNTDLAAQHALLSTAAYCEPETLENWDCGTPCEELGMPVENVKPVQAKFSHRGTEGVVRGFVGFWNNRCVLSLSDPFSPEESLALLQNSTADDLERIVDSSFPDCDDCKVHGVIRAAFEAMKEDLVDALGSIGCSKMAETTSHRRLITTGHGLGAAVASLAAFDLVNGTGYYKGSFGIEPTFNFGMPRIGNSAFTDAFKRLLAHEFFRVTHGKDSFLQFPKREEGFAHAEHELFFEGDASEDPSSYVRCTVDGENPACSQKHRGEEGSMEDHAKYLQPLVSVDMSAASCKTTSRFV